MKRYFLLVPLLLISFSLGFSAEQQQDQQIIKDALDETNYSLAYQLGRKLLEKEVEFRPDVIWQGLFDGYRNSSPHMTEEAMQAIWQQFEEQSPLPTAAQNQVKRVTNAVVGYRLKGQKFIAENSTKEGVNSLASGVQYKVLKTGQGKQPKPSDTVMVNYKAKTIEGYVYDSSYPLGIPTPTELKISALIPGLSETLPKMKEGDKWEIYIPTRMAYKDSGPMAGQTVIYELELLEILPEFH